MMKALIVEDRPEDRRLLSAYLQKNGYTVLQAANGAEGLRIALENRPDLIVSDLMMPGMDGFQFLREVRKSPELSGVCFVVYSATYSAKAEQELALTSGADGYILKPQEPDVFWQQLSAIVNRCRDKKAPRSFASDEQYIKKYSSVVGDKLVQKVYQLERTEEKAERSEVRCRQLINSVRDVMLVCDPGGHIQDANEVSLQQTFGFTLDEIRGKPLALLTEPEIGGADELEISPESPVVERSFRRKDGSVFRGEVSTYAFSEDAGMRGWSVSVLRDITERLKLQQQLMQTRMMESIGLFAGGVAHDFNNVMTAISGYAELLQLHLKNQDDSARSCLDQIRAAANRAAGLTRNILSFSGSQPYDPRPVVLNEVLENVSSLLGRILREDIELTTCITRRRLTVKADEGQLDQILINLSANARDAMPEGGRLAITLQPAMVRPGSESTLGLPKPGRYAHICIADSGHGMDEKTKERIFELFFTTKGKGQGTGLGMAVIYNIVKQHQGGISVESAPGEGTTFRIYLPLVRSHSKGAQRKEFELAPGGSETILVVEDDDAVLSFICHVLQKAGYQVLTAENGEEAIARFHENRDNIELVLSDVILPRKNGKEVYDTVKKVRPSLPFIFISGYTGEAIVDRDLQQEQITLLQKPVSGKDLLRQIRQALDR
jgi:two-component system, cell cycle sensor histidine kinase and response regulator CckA